MQTTKSGNRGISRGGQPDYYESIQAAVTSNNRQFQNPEIEALVPGVNGLEYKGGDFRDMARQYARMLSDPAMRQRLSASVLQTVFVRYSMDHMIDGFNHVFHWAAGRGTSHA